MKLYLTKHKGGQSRDITSLAVSWTWSGDKASITRQLELEVDSHSPLALNMMCLLPLADAHYNTGHKAA